MDCEHKDKIILYFYGELPEQQADGVKRHIGACASCAGELAVLKGLTARFEDFKPEPPSLRASALVAASRGRGFFGRSFAGLRQAAFAGAFMAAFVLAFQFMGARKGAHNSWNSDIDAGLDNIEYGIYNLEDDMLYSSSADFDYRYAGIETQRQRIAEKNT